MADKNDNLAAKRHSLAHLLAAAVMELWPDTKRTIGPAVDDGFYFDFEFSKPIGEGDFPKIEQKMREILPTWSTFQRFELTADEAKREYPGNEYKQELIDEFTSNGTGGKPGAEKKVSFYKSGNYWDLCRGGHVKDMSEIDPKSFCLHRLAGAYWRGDEKNKMLTRIYGLAFDTKEELAAHLAMLDEARKRDHRKIAKEQDLLVFSNLVGSGMPLFTPRGNVVRSEIVRFSRELNQELEFGEVNTPNVNKAELFKISGHYDKYKEDMLVVSSQYVSDEMFLKPMNCPMHTQIYAGRPRSYRDLPIRYADFAMLYRDERPGELSGLTRLRSFAQDDGHIFCREDQVEAEIGNVLNAIQKALAVYRIDYWMRLSLRDPQQKEKYLGSDEVWQKSEPIMRALLQKKGITFKEAEGEAAFYGPKIDIMAVDAIGREWQISTIQLDFNMPGRFGLEYIAEDSSKKTPVMIHRALIGSPDRFMGILIEHYSGAFPVWLAPEQVRLITVNQEEATEEFARQLVEQAKKLGVRIYTDDANESVGKKIRTAEIMKVPYAVVIGEKEVASGELMPRIRNDLEVNAEHTPKTVDEFLKTVAHEAKSRVSKSSL